MVRYDEYISLLPGNLLRQSVVLFMTIVYIYVVKMSSPLGDMCEITNTLRGPFDLWCYYI